MSSDPQEIAPGLWVNTYTGPAGTGSATRKRWQLTAPEGYLGLSYEQMCALRRWFLGPDAGPEWSAPACSEGGLETGGRSRGAAPGGA